MPCVCIKQCTVLMYTFLQYYNMVIRKNRNHSNAETMNFRKKYDRIVNQCMNLYLNEKYGLRGYTTVTSCVSNQKVVGDESEIRKLKI